MSYLFVRDVADQAVHTTVAEVRVLNETLRPGLLVGNVLKLEQTGRYSNGSANGRTCTIRLRLNGVRIIQAILPGQTSSALYYAQSQRWEVAFVATNQVRAVLRWGQGGLSGTSRALQTSLAADDIVDCAGHGFHVGQSVWFTALTGGAGLTINTTYYVTATSFGADTFRPATTQGGTPIDFTTDITAGNVQTQGSDTGAFGSVTTPGAGGTNRMGDVNTVVGDLASIDLGKPVQLEITIQPSVAAAAHEFVSMGVWGKLLGDGLTPAVRASYPTNFPLRRAG